MTVSKEISTDIAAPIWPRLSTRIALEILSDVAEKVGVQIKDQLDYQFLEIIYQETLTLENTNNDSNK